MSHESGNIPAWIHKPERDMIPGLDKKQKIPYSEYSDRNAAHSRRIR